MTTETTPPPVVDDRTLALLRNDLRGMSKDAMGALVAELTARMGVDPALAPIDILEEKAWNPDTRRKETTGLRLYINARGASELAKRWDLSDVALEIDIRESARVVIVQGAKTVPPNGRVVRDVGAAAFDPDRPDTTAQAVKKATTSCHRRVTLRAVGIFLDEPPEAPDAT